MCAARTWSWSPGSADRTSSPAARREGRLLARGGWVDTDIAGAVRLQGDEFRVGSADSASMDIELLLRLRPGSGDKRLTDHSASTACRSVRDGAQAVCGVITSFFM